MQRSKSIRHQRAARARWRAAEERAQAERDAGIPDDPMPSDCRDVVTLDLRSWGGKRWRIEPRLGYVSGRAINEETGEVEHCAAIKELLRLIARDTVRMMSPRSMR